ncbi:MAG: glycosyltransferase family 1 protein [Nitrososphaerales archaeon]
MLSHLRWDFVYQRPQHLLSRAARTRRVFFWEEALPTPGEPRLEVMQKLPQLWVVRPYLPDQFEGQAREDYKAGLVRQFLAEQGVERFVAWYYTPWALRFTRGLTPLVTVYDCMDELSMFKGANPQLKTIELELFSRADVVFTGGPSLYEAKRIQHANVHLFPSSIDAGHFGRARELQTDPADQAGISHPRVGFFGVIDERMDLELVARVAQLRPHWRLVLIGPIVKIDPKSAPQAPNIHYLGQKPYDRLPEYLAGWDVALMPFAHNDATRFISPTKTPEYLAGGRPVVSTSIRDVVRPYGENGLVRIADTPEETVAAVEAALVMTPEERAKWLARVDEFLKQDSWDRTWEAMDRLIQDCAIKTIAETEAQAISAATTRVDVERL